ncbi:hypothetical protein JCM8547_007045 [Rhodosporidiobolus lusitaniae]
MLVAAALALPLLPLALAGTAKYDFNNQPTQSESGQTGYNNCGTSDSQDAKCQTAVINSVTDFCLWAPPTAGGEIGAQEEVVVAWCTASGHGARVMPEGTIHSAHYLKTPHYTQITGTGDFTKINVKAGDEGGELDPHGATGNGNPIGSLVYANGVQAVEWMSFISDTEYCFRVCNQDDPDAWLWCQHVYDTMGCAWVEPGDYDSGFDSCDGDGTVNPPGIYTGSDGKRTTFSQGDGHTPSGMAPGASSNCQAVATVGGNAVAVTPSTTTSSAAASSSTSSASSVVSTAASSSSVSTDSSVASFVTSTLSSSASSSDVSFSASETSSSLNSTSAASSVSTVTSTSTLSSATSPVSTAGQRAAASASASGSSGATSLVASTFGSLAAVAGAIAYFA